MLSLVILLATVVVLALAAITLGCVRAGASLMRENEALRRDNAHLVDRLYQWSQGHNMPTRPPALMRDDIPPTPATSFFVTRKPARPN